MTPRPERRGGLKASSAKTIATDRGRRDVPSHSSIRTSIGLDQLGKMEIVAADTADDDCGGPDSLSMNEADEVPACVARSAGMTTQAKGIEPTLDVTAPPQSAVTSPVQAQPKENIVYAQRLRQTFAAAGDDSDAGERLLEDFVATESSIAVSLLDAEATAVLLLQHTMTTNPELALQVAHVAKEVFALGSALRRRTQGALASAASLRTQRLLLQPQSRQHGK
jgi:hypothetical protein